MINLLPQVANLLTVATDRYRTYVTGKSFEFDFESEHPYEHHEWVIKHYRDHD